MVEQDTQVQTKEKDFLAQVEWHGIKGHLHITGRVLFHGEVVAQSHGYAQPDYAYRWASGRAQELQEEYDLFLAEDGE